MYFKQYVGLNKINTVLEIGPSWQNATNSKIFKKIKYYFIDQTISSMIDNGEFILQIILSLEKLLCQR